MRKYPWTQKQGGVQEWNAIICAACGSSDWHNMKTAAIPSKLGAKNNQSGTSMWSFAKYLKALGAADVLGLVAVKSQRDSDNQ